MTEMSRTPTAMRRNRCVGCCDRRLMSAKTMSAPVTATPVAGIALSNWRGTNVGATVSVAWATSRISMFMMTAVRTVSKPTHQERPVKLFCFSALDDVCVADMGFHLSCCLSVRGWMTLTCSGSVT